MYWYFTASGGYDAFRALYPSFCTSRASADSTETNLMQIDTAPSVAAVTPPHDLSEPSTSPVTSYMKGDTIKYRPSQDQVILSHSLFSSLVKLSLIKLSFSLPNWCSVYMEHVRVCNWVLHLYVQAHVSFAYWFAEVLCITYVCWVLKHLRFQFYFYVHLYTMSKRFFFCIYKDLRTFALFAGWSGSDTAVAVSRQRLPRHARVATTIVGHQRIAQPVPISQSHAESAVHESFDWCRRRLHDGHTMLVSRSHRLHR